MEKAYDLKALGEMMAAEGLPIAKEAAEAAGGKMYIVLKKWLQESAVLSENKMDDVVMPFIGQLDSIVQPMIDKIDGAVG